MAFITSQWLKGNPLTNKPSDPVGVRLKASSRRDNWMLDNAVVATIYATKSPADDYQAVFLTVPDIDTLLPVLTPNADASVQRATALSSLLPLDAPDFLRFLEEVFAARATNSSKGARVSR